MEQNKNFNIIFVNILCAVLEGSLGKTEKKSKLFKSDRRRIMFANHFCTPVSLHLTMFAFEKVVHFYCQLKWIIGLLSIQCVLCTHLCYTKRAQIEKRNMKQKQKQKQKAEKSQQPVFIPEVIRMMLEFNILNQLMRTLRSVFVSCDAKGVNLN